MAKLVPKILLGLAAGLLLIQLIRPERTNPPVTGALTTPADVDAVLRRSCYDCHSNETVWPWYAHLAPVSWLVVRDVNEGRKELNFSEWSGYDAKRKAKKLKEIAKEVEEGEMPMAIYPPLHPEAKLSTADAKRVVEWARGGLVDEAAAR